MGDTIETAQHFIYVQVFLTRLSLLLSFLFQHPGLFLL